MRLVIVFSVWALQSFLAWGLYWGKQNRAVYNYFKPDWFDFLFPLYPVSFLVLLGDVPLSWAWAPLTKLQRYRIYCERFPILGERTTYNTFDERGR